jgi:hypothetical protein
MNAFDLRMLLPLFAIEAPMILLPVVGLILARSKLLPRGSASLLATLGFVLLLVHAASQLAFQLYLARNSAQDIIGFITVWSTVLRALFLAALICLSCAIFVGRPRIES